MSYTKQFEEAKKAGKIKDLTPEYIEFKEKGTTVCGVLVSSNPVQSTLSEGSYNQYLMETDQGLIKFALGAAADRELENVLFKGGLYSITFLGKEDIKGGRRVNKFQVHTIESLPVEEAFPDETPEIS
jgi:hypothetical protein